MLPFRNLPFQLVIATATVVLANVVLNTSNFVVAESKKTVVTTMDYLHLENVRASEITVGTRNTNYIFTINIPKTSKPIEKVLITQRGRVEQIQFNGRVRAAGSSAEQKKIEVSKVEIDRQMKGIIATFNPSVQPGQRLTVTLGVKENPISDGNYLFDVAVVPEGKSEAISLGIGRLRITSIR
ncbi:MAG: DUF2808 domain-containing protein [Calothrix sp. SM1_7_51]|nr:DUF2808 domain-containing protein [Calothrix sp. SM1_7_51]